MMDAITKELEKRLGWRPFRGASWEWCVSRHLKVRTATWHELTAWRLLRRLLKERDYLSEALIEMAAEHECGCGHPYCNNCKRDRMCAEALGAVAAEQGKES